MGKARCWRVPRPADETTPDLLPDGPIRPDGVAGDPRGELALAREIRAREMVAGRSPAQIAAIIRAECGPGFCTTWIRAYRLALGIALADVVAQVRAWYAAEGRKARGSARRCCPRTRAGRNVPGPSTCIISARSTALTPAILVTTAAVSAVGRTATRSRHRPRAGPARGRNRRHVNRRRRERARPWALTRRAGAALAAVPWAETNPAGLAPGGAARSGCGPAPGRPGQHAQPAAGTGRAGQPGGCLGSHLSHGLHGGTGPGQGDILRAMLLRLLANSAAAADSQFFGAVEHVRRDLDEALLSRSVSVSMLDQWEETTAGYGARYMSVPPLRLLCDVLLDLGDVRRMCAQRQPIDCAERLCRLAAQLAGLVGIIMIDLGDQRLARSYFRTARTAADETGDRRLRAWVAVRESLVPLYYGDPREAASLARAATDLAGRNRCVAGVMSRVIEARALARMAGRGRREALDRARAVFDQAQESLSELPADACADTAFGYTERQLAFHAGDALAALGDGQGGMRSFSRALRLYPAAEFLDRTLVLFGEARSLVEAGEPEQAMGIGQQALVGLPREHRTELVLLAARGLGVAVAAQHPSLPALRGYSDALRTGLWPVRATAQGTMRRAPACRRDPDGVGLCQRRAAPLR